jgi:hypothetical protein
MVEAKLLRKKLKNGLIVDKWDLVTIIEKQQTEIEALKKDNKELHAIAQRMAMAESDARKSLQWFKDVQAISSGEKTILTDEEINVVAILQDAEIVPVGHEIWKTGEEFNKYKRIVLATAKALRKAQENG